MGMRVIQVTIEYEFGDIVYLKTDTEGLQRVVVGYELRLGRVILYQLQAGSHEPSSHYGFEITSDLTEVGGLYRKLLE